MREPLSERRAWQLALKRVTALEAQWNQRVARQRGLLELKHWLSDQTHLPRLQQLADLLRPEMSLTQFYTVLVPIERKAARTRVTDVQILEGDEAHPAASASCMHVTLVVDSLRSAFNIGGLFRTAECLGASDLWLCGYTATPGHPHVAEAALGADQIVPWRTFPRAAQAIAELQARAIPVIALETVTDAENLTSFNWSFPCALLLGNERFGLSPDLIQIADARIRIPLYGQKNSLNVVNAAAIALHEMRCAWEKLSEEL